MAQTLCFPINHATVQCGYHNENKTPAYKWQNCPLYETLDDGHTTNWAAAGHFGMDFTGWYNPFFASGTGVVLGLSNTASNTVGRWIAIKYTDVVDYGELVVRYYHLATIDVYVGQPVDINTKIATYGKTGSKPTGEHLHVEVDTDTKYWNYTPTLASANGGLYPGYRDSRDTTLNPAYVFKLKTSAPENQDVVYPGNDWYTDPNFSSFK